jgi:hypothetical protein
MDVGKIPQDPPMQGREPRKIPALEISREIKQLYYIFLLHCFLVVVTKNNVKVFTH